MTNRPAINLWLSFLTLVICLPPAALAENQKPPLSAAPAETTKRAALPNFHEVHPYLYRGGEPSSQGIGKLQAQGIRTVIDLRGQSPGTRAEKAQVEKLGMRYITLPMSNAAPTEQQVDTFIETVKEGQAKSEPVFVHCAHGSDRTGCMVGIWRVSQDGFSYDRAYSEMKKYYFGLQYTQLSAAVKKRAVK